MDNITSPAENTILNYLKKVDSASLSQILEKLHVTEDDLEGLLYPTGGGFVSIGNTGGNDRYWLNNAGRAYLYVDDNFIKKLSIALGAEVETDKKDIDIWTDFDDDGYPCIRIYFAKGSPVGIEQTENIIYEHVSKVSGREVYVSKITNDLPIESTFTFKSRERHAVLTAVDESADLQINF